MDFRRIKLELDVAPDFDSDRLMDRIAAMMNNHYARDEWMDTRMTEGVNSQTYSHGD